MLFEVNENLMFKMRWRVDVMTHTTKSIFRTDFLFASNLFSSWTIDLWWFHRKLQTIQINDLNFLKRVYIYYVVAAEII